MCPGQCGIMESSLLPLLGSVLACVLGVGGYSHGRVEVSCTDMQPRHRSSPQTTPPPFTLSTDRVDYSAGEDVTVNLLAPSSSHFEGFLLQARVLGSESAAGSFLSAPSGTQRLSCGGSANSALSHSSSSQKSSVQVTWRPAADQDVHFYATIVQNITVYWVAVASPRVRFSSGSNSTGGTSSLEPANTTVPSSAVSSMMTTAPLGITVEGCGASRLCFRQPPDCDPAQEPAACFFMSAMVLSPGSSAVHYQLSGPSPGYIAFGFSDDRNMGNDDIYICVVDASGRVQLQHAFSSGATTPDTVPLGSVWDIRTSVEAGVISCSFSTTNSIITQRSSQRHYLLYAHGPSSNGQVQMHSGTFVSADTVDVSSPGQELRTYRPLIIKAHGALMLVAWMSAGSLGMMVARFNKKLGKGRTMCGKELWFVVHVSIMCVTVAATIIAFILAFSHARSWSGGAHPVLGCLLMILSLLQPLGAVLRCGPQHPRRFLFNWSHALNAVVIKGLAVSAIFTGLRLIDSSQNQWLLKVMGGFVGWEALYFLLSDLDLRWNQNNDDTHGLKVVMGGPLVPGLFLLGNLAFLVALLVGISMS